MPAQTIIPQSATLIWIAFSMSRFPANQFILFFFDQNREVEESARHNLRQLLCAAKERTAVVMPPPRCASND